MQVGTGFSFTNSTLGLSTNESEVATNLYSSKKYRITHTDMTQPGFYN